jgi:hypothetical protein
MRLTSPAALIAGLAAVAIAAWLILGAATTKALIPVADLIATFDEAERRPAGANFEVSTVTLDGETHRAIATPGASRMTWSMRLPDHAVVHVAVALKPEAWTQEGDGVLFRIGIAEGRTHEDLLTRVVNPYGQPDDRRWIPLSVDLRDYSGFKWSLFYHPRRMIWRIVFNTNAGLPGTNDPRADMPLWGDPQILRIGSK